MDTTSGSAVSRYAGENVHKRLLSELTYAQGAYPEALKRAFLGTDEDMRASPEFARDASGCTAVSALVTKDGRLFVANAGDSRSVISCKGEVKALSKDHKPGDDLEKKRVIAAGGALGDFEYKKNKSLPDEEQIITCDPDVSEHLITSEDEFFIVACDGTHAILTIIMSPLTERISGIWDCLSSQQCIDVVRRLVAQGKTLPEICEIVCDLCLAPDTNSGAGIGCDNMTILIVALLHGRTEAEWYQWVKSRVEQNIGYTTPATLPNIYSATRLSNYETRKAMHKKNEEARAQEKAVQEQWLKDHPDSQAPRKTLPGTFERGGIFDDILREMQAAGNIQILSQQEMDDDDDFGNYREDGSDGNILTFSEEAEDGADADADGDHPMADVTSSLKQQVDELVRGDSSAVSETTPVQGEAPPEPVSKPAAKDVPVEQLHSDPGGDAPSSAVRAEGLLDKSDDPTKV
ncbi:hypothetical protein EUX98_g6194 [Antrodiella citrinella]|uniref:protein-serine/threonine phosphatase n=1 Tax=Antrodiella citrinella TaxID=2447956 RepID=A0A4S4MS86_9APHY|nr:hypothetical protein EUX98_g6194 [Antrodiella citrinella]